MDFFGEEHHLRFVIRAYHPNEVLDAMYWCSLLTFRRQQYDLFKLSESRINLHEQCSSRDHSGFDTIRSGQRINVKIMVPVVSVQKLKEEYSLGFKDEHDAK